MQTFRTTLGAIALAILAPMALSAQQAIGLPDDFAGPSIYAGYGFVDGADAYGIEARKATDLFGTVNVSYENVRPDVGDISMHRIGLGAAMGLDILPDFSAITIRSEYSRMSEGDVSMYRVPVGMSLGTGLDVAGLDIFPYVNPEYGLTRVAGFNDWSLGLRAGGEFRADWAGQFSLRFGVEDADLDDWDPMYRIQLGYSF